MTHQGGPFPQAHADTALLELRLGQPAPELLPLASLEAAARERLGAGNDPLILQYGTAQGYLAFREALASFLTRAWTDLVEPDELFVTAGISSALGMLAQNFARPGDHVACGDPTYFLARGILETAHLRPVGIPVDARGIDVSALARALDRGLKIAFAYIIPAFHNPCGVTLSPERAERLVELAQRYDFVIFADEPYPLLNFGARPPSMMRYDRGRSRVLSLGSFSKILGPGLRLGWIHAAPTLIERILEHGVLRSGGGLNPLVSSIVHGTLSQGTLDQNVERLRHALQRRALALCRALDRHIPSFRYLPPEGGYFIWGQLPEGIDTTALVEHARSEYGVGFAPGRQCAIERDLSRWLRLSFSFYDEVELEEAVTRLARALDSFGLP